MKQTQPATRRRAIVAPEIDGSAAKIAETALQSFAERSRTPAVEPERLEINYPLSKLTPSSDNPRRISLDRAGVTPERVGELAVRPTETLDQWVTRLDAFLETLRLSDPPAFDTWSDLFDLAISLYTGELLQPIVANQKGVIIAGERRWTASFLASKAYNRVIIRSMAGDEEAMYRLIENLQRSDLSVAEQAAGARSYFAEMTGMPCGPDNKQIDIKLVRQVIGGGQTRAAYLRAICRLPEGDDLLKSILAGGYNSLRAAYEAASERLSEIRRSSFASDADDEQLGDESATAAPKPTSTRTSSKSTSRQPTVKARLPGTNGGVQFLQTLTAIPGISAEMTERVQSVATSWPGAPEKVRKNLLSKLMDSLFEELDSQDEEASEP